MSDKITILDAPKSKKKQLLLQNYQEQQKSWPKKGQHIMAQFDDESIVVYQAFNKEIAEYAVKNNCFGGDKYSTSRMTWIKTNFLWMQYRSGWSTKKDQERTLAIWLKRSSFERILKAAVHSHFVEGVYEKKEDWEKKLKDQEGVIRLQWDPDHGPMGNKLDRRAIQLGIKGSFLKGFLINDGDIIEIQDVSEFCLEQFQKNVKDQNENKYENLITPMEREYILEDEDLKKSLEIGKIVERYEKEKKEFKKEEKIIEKD